MPKKNIVLIQPKSGSYDKIVVDMPLGLIYASLLAKKNGYEIKIVDTRVDNDWKTTLQKTINKNTVLAGLSVMTGRPIYYALEVSKYIKENYGLPIVWGGAHATIAPDNVLENKYIDFLCRGDGEGPLYNLVNVLCENKSSKDEIFKSIIGLSYKNNGSVYHNPVMKRNQIVDWRDIPYDLIDSYSYHRFNSSEKIFSVLTSIGCPHKCRFCYLSAADMRHKWFAYGPEDTVEYLLFIVEKFNPDHISIIDNDFFVDMKRVKRIFELIQQRKVHVQFGFRGARVSDLDKMDDSVLELMSDINVKHLHIGVESGSQDMLDFYKKGIKVEQVVRVNRKLKKYPKILPSYNFFGGTPTETMEDLRKSVSLIHKLVIENPHCQISAFNQYVPFPGGNLSKVAGEYGFISPKNLEEWAGFDDAEVAHQQLPWLDSEKRELLLAMNFCGVFIDRKIPSHFTGMAFYNIMYRLGWRILNPIARFRVKYQFFKFPVEYYALRSFHHLLDQDQN